MFNRKKKRIAELLRDNERLWEDQKEHEAQIRKMREEADQQQAELDKLKKDNAELQLANRKLKRDLETESRQKEELASLLTDAQKQVEEVKYKWGTENEEQAHTIEDLRQKLKNAEWREQHRKAGHGDAADRPACPDDCVKYANPGPGASACRNCIRNPRAVDKYKVAE